MPRALLAIREKLEQYALARFQLLKAQDDGINGEVGEDDFFAARRSEDERWRALVDAIDGAIDKASRWGSAPNRPSDRDTGDRTEPESQV
jgi:hypothetical protein